MDRNVSCGPYYDSQFLFPVWEGLWLHQAFSLKVVWRRGFEVLTTSPLPSPHKTWWSTLPPPKKKEPQTELQVENSSSFLLLLFWSRSIKTYPSISLHNTIPLHIYTFHDLCLKHFLTYYVEPSHNNERCNKFRCYISSWYMMTIGNFRVVFCLCFKASPSAKPFIWKLVLFTCKWTKICVWIKLIFILEIRY